MKNKSSKKAVSAALTITAATAVLTAVSSYFTTKKLVKIALDREKPKSNKKAEKMITGSIISEELQNKLAEASEKLCAAKHETVEITGRDGVNLTGHWFPCENAKRVIVAMHGWRSSWCGDFGMIADFWFENGCSVLFAEQRGQNNSGGDYMTFGLIERYDCLDWAKWVSERTDGKAPVYLAGISMGGATVLMASGLELPDSVKGIMSDCGFTSPHEIWKHVVNKNLHMSYGYYKSVLADRMCKQRIQMGAADYSTIDALKTTNIPVLFIHGTDDRFVPVKMTYDNYKACAGPKRLFVVPGAEHGMSYCIDKDGYEKAVRDFWRDYD